MPRAARPRRAWSPLVVLSLFALLRPIDAGPLTTSLPHVQGTRAIVLEQLEAVLAADPELQFVGQGSWLRSGAKTVSKAGGVSRAYVDPLLGGSGSSDHDLRLVMQAKDDAALAARWRGAQTRLRDGIRALFPRGADVKTLEQTLMRYGFSAADAANIAKQGADNVVNTVLRSVNVYSPPQLVRFVVDEKTATATFKRLGTVPNLGGKIVEGVWGEGSLVATQEFELGGRLFYRTSGGTLKTGFVDLVHMAEGYGRYSFGGAANMSTQWAEKAIEALDSSDLSLVAKYMKRLKETLTVAVKKGDLKGGALRTTFDQLEQFIARAELGEAAVGADLRSFLRTARMQSRVLGELARNPGAMDREIMLAILEAKPAGRFARVGQWFQQMWPSAESLAVFERALQAAFVAYSTWQVSGTWGERGMEDALRQAGMDAAMIVSLPVGAVLALTNALIDSAKDFGYNMAVQPQEWREFLAGISSVKGYEGTLGIEMSVERLAVQAVSPEQVAQAVELQAFNISRLKITEGVESEATTSARDAIKERLMARMTPIVLAEWTRERRRLIVNYLDLALQLDDRMNDLILTAAATRQPVMVDKSGPVSVDVQLTMGDDLKGLQDLLARMEAAIRPLGGRYHIVPFGYKGTVVWQQDGKTRLVDTTTNLRGLLEPVAFQFPGQGTFPMQARFTLEITAPSLGGLDEARDVFDAQALLARRYERTIPFTVDVVAPTRGSWKLVHVEDMPRASGRQEAPSPRGTAQAYTVGEVLFSKSSVTSRLSGTRDEMVDVFTLKRVPYVLEQVTSWTDLPEVIVPGVTYTTTLRIAWTSSDERVMPAARAYHPDVFVSCPGSIHVEVSNKSPVATVQWKLDDPGKGEVQLGAPPFSAFAQVHLTGPGGGAERLYRWDWVVAGGK